MNESKQSPKIKTKENLFINLGFNILIPILILRKGDDWLGESLGNLTNTHANSTLVSSILLAIAIFFQLLTDYMTLHREKSAIYLVF